MSIFDKTYMWNQLVETAQQYNEEQLLALAKYLCQAANLNPGDNVIGPFLCRKLCDNNLHGVALWLRKYLAEEDQLPTEVDLDECEQAFRSALHQRVPAHLLGDID